MPFLDAALVDMFPEAFNVANAPAFMEPVTYTSELGAGAVAPTSYGAGDLMASTEPGWASATQVADTVTPFKDTSSSGLGGLSKWWEGLSTEKKLLYGAGLPFLLSNMMAERRRYQPPGQTPYTGPLSKFSYDPAQYSPYRYKPMAAGGTAQTPNQNYAGGGITGSGQLDLHIPLNMSGGAGGGGMGGGLGSMGGGGGSYPFGQQQNLAATPLPQQHAQPARQFGMPQQPVAQNHVMAAPPDPSIAQNYRQQQQQQLQQQLNETLDRWKANNPNAQGFQIANQYNDYARQLGLPQQQVAMRSGGLAALAGGGMSNLGGYSDGGRLLRGPGDGVSDSIPAMIGQKQPARLADGEFVVPARIVSELGNGSTEAGARQLYAMMDRVQKARAQTTAKGKMAKDTKAERYLPV